MCVRMLHTNKQRSTIIFSRTFSNIFEKESESLMLPQRERVYSGTGLTLYI